MRRNKYSNVRTVIDGITFDSKAEARHYCVLKAMENSGLIKMFTRQVRFIIATVGKRTRSYIADFVITLNDNTVEVHDVKGFKTPVYQLKKFLMEEKHGIKIIEIK